MTVRGASALKNEDTASWSALGQCSDLGLGRSNEPRGWCVLSEVSALTNRPKRKLLYKSAWWVYAKLKDICELRSRCQPDTKLCFHLGLLSLYKK